MKKVTENITVAVGEYYLFYLWSDILHNSKSKILRNFLKVGKYCVYKTDYYKLVFSKQKGTVVSFSAPGKLIIELGDKTTIITAITAKKIVDNSNLKLNKAYTVKNFVGQMLTRIEKKERVNARV